MNQGLKSLRHLISEVRQSASNPKMNGSTFISYVFRQYRRFQVTDQQLCKAKDEMAGLTNGYVTYLQSMRKYNDLRCKYHSTGERSTKQAAELVGLKLPHDPK